MEKPPIGYLSQPTVDNSTIRFCLFVTDDNREDAQSLLLEALNITISAAQKFGGKVISNVPPIDTSAIIPFSNVSQVVFQFPSKSEINHFLFYISL